MSCNSPIIIVYLKLLLILFLRYLTLNCLQKLILLLILNLRYYSLNILQNLHLLLILNIMHLSLYILHNLLLLLTLYWRYLTLNSLQKLILLLILYLGYLTLYTLIKFHYVLLFSKNLIRCQISLTNSWFFLLFSCIFYFWTWIKNKFLYNILVIYVIKCIHINIFNNRTFNDWTLFIFIFYLL